jgi:hypothetical protein
MQYDRGDGDERRRKFSEVWLLKREANNNKFF